MAAPYDQTSSQALMDPGDVLALKRTNLAAPGIKQNSLYYGVGNSTVDTVEITYRSGSYQQGLPQLSFGGTSNVIIANSSFVGQTYIHLELENIWPGQTLSRGWGYGAIATLSYLFGSSNMSNVRINGQSVWHCVAMECETAEKRSELFRLGGEEQLGPIMRVGPGGVPERDPDARLTADVLLPLPWSTAAGIISKKTFDTNILQNPLTVSVAFANNSAIFGGSTTPNRFPNSFSAAYLTVRQGDLSNKDMSLRTTLMRNPDQSVLYPFIFRQTYMPSSFRGSRSRDAPVTVPLNSFINADLLALTVSVIRTSQLSPPQNGAPNWHQQDNIRNVALSYNGQNYFIGADASWKLMTTISSAGSQNLLNSLVQVVPPFVAEPAQNSFTSVPQDCYDLHIDFSAIRSMSFEGHFQNVWRIGQNVMTLSFTTEGDSSVEYQMYCTYHYNAVAQVQQGQTLMYM